MVAQMVLSAESLAADFTRVWTFIGVCSLVDEQVVGLGEVPFTVLADELLLWPIRATTASRLLRQQKPKQPF
jgi:hypothetical protein